MTSLRKLPFGTFIFKSVSISSLYILLCAYLYICLFVCTGEKTLSKSSTIRNVTWGKSTYFPGHKDFESDMIKCDELSKEKPDDDQFMCYQNQGYEDEELGIIKGHKAIAEGSESDASQEEKPKDIQFTFYQNEGYENSESNVTKGSGKPDDQTESQSIDDLL